MRLRGIYVNKLQGYAGMLSSKCLKSFDLLYIFCHNFGSFGCWMHSLVTKIFEYLQWNKRKQGRIRGYPSRVWVSRGHNWGHKTIWAGEVRSKNKIHEKGKMVTDRPTDWRTKQGVMSRSTRLKQLENFFSIDFCYF